MWKVSLISFIIFIVTFLVMIIDMASMSEIDRAVYRIRGNWPKRIQLAGGIILISFVVSVISLIIWIIML